MYKISTPGGVTYTSFKDYTPFVGKEVEREVKTENVTGKNGQTYVRQTILEPKTNGGVNNKALEIMFEKLGRMEGKLDEVLSRLPKVSGEVPEPTDEDIPAVTPTDDLPF